MTSDLPIRALVTGVAPACIAQPALAQSGAFGRVEGTVTDSVHAGPLASVRVQAVGIDSPGAMRGAATTDSSGQLRIDALPPGRYMVGFASPLLGSLEISLPPRAVTIEPGRAASVELALLPAAKLRAAVCPRISLPPGTGEVRPSGGCGVGQSAAWCADGSVRFGKGCSFGDLSTRVEVPCRIAPSYTVGTASRPR